jgi:hypothetical protein
MSPIRPGTDVQEMLLLLRKEYKRKFNPVPVIRSEIWIVVRNHCLGKTDGSHWAVDDKIKLLCKPPGQLNRASLQGHGTTFEEIQLVEY